MEALILIAIVIVVFIVFKMTRKKATFDGTPEAGKVLAKNGEWLEKRWARAGEADKSQSYSEFQEWYFDEPTDSQVEYLRDLGITRFPKNLSKGQVSDLIGLFELPEGEDILKFFKVSMRGMNQTKARDAIGRIMSDPEKAAKWNNRPPTPIQKEFFRFFDLPIPKDLTHDEMEKEIQKIAYDQTERRSDQWDAFVTIYDDLSDPEFRRDEEIKAVSLKMLRDFVASKREQGVAIEDLDSYEVADELMALNPALRQ